MIDSSDVAGAKVRSGLRRRAVGRGVSYDSLLAKHHDPTEEKGRASSPSIAILCRLPTRAALTGAKTGTITNPFPLANPRGPSKFAVLQVVTLTDAGEYNPSEIREQIRAQLSEERSIRQLLDELRKQTYVSLRM